MPNVLDVGKGFVGVFPTSHHPSFLPSLTHSLALSLSRSLHPSLYPSIPPSLLPSIPPVGRVFRIFSFDATDLIVFGTPNTVELFPTGFLPGSDKTNFVWAYESLFQISHLSRV